MVMERTENEIIIRLPANSDPNDIQEMIDYINFKSIKSKKEISDVEIEEFSSEIDTIIWDKFNEKHKLI